MQEHDESLITIGRKYRLNSKVLNEERPYWVHLPASYHDTIHAPQYYPVLYLLDGDSHFHSVTGVVNFMGAGINGNIQIPECIVVALPNTDRTRDLTPTHSTLGYFGNEVTFLETSGGANAFLQFIQEELFPVIESSYRTLPYQVLVGHSFGGLLALHSLLDAQGMFQAHIAIDPSVWWDKEVITNNLNQMVSDGKKLKATLYISLANSANKTSETAARAFSKTLESFLSSDSRFKLEYFDKEDHGSVPLLSLYHGLLHVFADYKPSIDEVIKQPSYLVTHFENLSKQLGITLRPPEGFVNGLGLYLLNEEKEIEKAFEVLRINAANYPDSYNVYKSLAEAYEVKKETALAVEHYQKALALNPDVQEVKDQLSKLQESLGS